MVAPIVVGIDASAPSRAALCWAADHCAGFGASLVLLHAVGRCSPDTDPGSTERARAFVDGEADYARSRYPGLVVTAELAHAEPFDALVSASRAATLTVIGTHKTGFIHGRSLGSRFLGLAAMARSPMAYIPAGSMLTRRGVVVAAEDTATGSRAIGLAAAEAERLDQDLVMVQSPSNDATASALVTAAATPPRLRVRRKVTRRGIALELIDASTTASLVVMAHADAGGALGTPSGSDVHDLLMNLGGPALIVPRDETDNHYTRVLRH